MNLLKKIFVKIFGIKQKSVRRYIKDVKPGEKIRIEWSKIDGRIGYLTCLNNDPETKKIFLEVKWANYIKLQTNEKEQLVLDYDDLELKNFHLLNSIAPAPVETKTDDDDIETLQKKLNEALEKEEYEIAGELRNKINKLTKNGK